MKRRFVFLITVALFIFLATHSSALVADTKNIVVLCDGKLYDGYKKKPFVLKSVRHKDPTVQKVIRNCIFRNSDLPAIVIWDAKNILIEGNTFENIRTNVPGKGVHAINIPCRNNCAIDNVTIRNNVFRLIGADGIQLGEEGREIRRVRIIDNKFFGSEEVGENGIDIKGVEGPIRIIRNEMSGFRPCRNQQDCSGSPGEAMVIHDGHLSGIPRNILVRGNTFSDSVYGLTVSDRAQNIRVRHNTFSNNLEIGLLVNQTFSIRIINNTLSNNPKHIRIQYTPVSGGFCVRSGNKFNGAGIPIDLKESVCPNE